MKKYIVAIDQGTTGTTVLILDKTMQICGRGYAEVPQHFPKPGWVEQAGENIWNSVLKALGQALSQAACDPFHIAAIGLTNQRETVLCFDRKGVPLHPAIVWQDRRTAEDCERLRREGHEPSLQKQTGLLLDPYFSATKMAWLLQTFPSLRKKVEAGEALFGTVDAFLMYRLSGTKSYVSDVTNASRTLLFDLDTLSFSEKLCSLFGVPLYALPSIVPSQGICAKTMSVPGIPDGIPIAAVLGDQQAALFGQGCLSEGQAKCTYGTGAFLLLNTGERRVHSSSRLLGTVAWQREQSSSRMTQAETAYAKTVDKRVAYALEGSAFVAGSFIQWLRDGLGLIQASGEIESLAASVPDSGGVTVVPALTGLGAPYWQPEARGLCWGMTRGTTRGHIARASLEGIALQICDLVEAMEKDTGVSLQSLRVDGGMAKNDLFLQIQADLLHCEIIRSRQIEATALGVGFLAGIEVEMISEEFPQTQLHEDRRFMPSLSNAERKSLKHRWKEAVARSY